MVGDILRLIVFAHNAALDHVVTSHEETTLESKLTFAVSLWESQVLNFLTWLNNISPACKATICSHFPIAFRLAKCIYRQRTIMREKVVDEMKTFSHCPFYYCVIKTQAQNRLRQIYLLMKITRRFEVKYSYLSLLSPVQNSVTGLTLPYGPRGSHNDIANWLPLEGTFKRDKEASMPPFRLHCPRRCKSAFPESKEQQSSRALCVQKAAGSQDIVRKLASADSGGLLQPSQASELTWAAGGRLAGLNLWARSWIPPAGSAQNKSGVTTYQAPHHQLCTYLFHRHCGLPTL